MMSTVRVVRWETTDDVVWTGGDGKPRCAKHPHICLVRANSIGDPFTLYAADAYVCAACMRESR